MSADTNNSSCPRGWQGVCISGAAGGATSGSSQKGGRESLIITENTFGLGPFFTLTVRTGTDMKYLVGPEDSRQSYGTPLGWD